MRQRIYEAGAVCAGENRYSHCAAGDLEGKWRYHARVGDGRALGVVRADGRVDGGYAIGDRVVSLRGYRWVQPADC